MRHGVLEMTPIPHFICANLYAIFGVEASSFPHRAATAVDVVTRNITS
jgi:hypothetical protein